MFCPTAYGQEAPIGPLLQSHYQCHIPLSQCNPTLPVSIPLSSFQSHSSMSIPLFQAYIYYSTTVREHSFSSPSCSVSSPPILPTSIVSTYIIPQCHQVLSNFFSNFLFCPSDFDFIYIIFIVVYMCQCIDLGSPASFCKSDHSCPYNYHSSCIYSPLATRKN
jgi:hypothetical protein